MRRVYNDDGGTEKQSMNEQDYIVCILTLLFILPKNNNEKNYNILACLPSSQYSEYSIPSIFIQSLF